MVELEDDAVVVAFAAISRSPGAALFDEELACFDVLDEEMVPNGCKSSPVVSRHPVDFVAWNIGWLWDIGSDAVHRGIVLSIV